ncbi:unnamed protein product [Chondrus crispus]|uniref:Serine/threonine-protein kinase RIO2 n=1 Tax=Chondrus crispus TaxID=2769 RepID=R7QJX4_CHOCR|nr:unnamed protein product [Chondrus crispus]CDF38023.1 unnamed protein product [Chondrus crispus]|eukprot:XP_005717892.1 unnamed protein product [Chondrus crispus]
MKLDPSALRYLSDDDFRVLTAIEMGMRNHELVPIPLISAISGLRHGGYMKSLKEVHKNKLVHKETKRYVGYRLTSMGYDYLALRALVKRGVIEAVGRAIGVGKEADVFIVSASEALMDELPDLSDTPHLAMKIHRLGRTSFRAVKQKRDYLVHRKSASWIYFSRLAATKEYAFMCALHERGFAIPRPLGQSRHVVVMELCSGVPLTQVSELGDPVAIANKLLKFAVRLAQHGLVHCDLNEFNIMIDDDENITVIDFPQMVSTCHVDAEELFDRDINGILRFFVHRFGVVETDLTRPKLSAILAERGDEDQLDAMVAASGFKNIANEDQYGEQDLGGEVDGEDEEVFENIDMRSLQLSVPQEDFTDHEGAPAAGCIPNSSERVSGDDAGVEENLEVESRAGFDKPQPGMEINRALIESRVRRQRGNQSQRRQMARRNVVKDSEKRKIKVEMSSDFW